MSSHGSGQLPPMSIEADEGYYVQEEHNVSGGPPMGMGSAQRGMTTRSNYHGSQRYAPSSRGMSVRESEMIAVDEEGYYIQDEHSMSIHLGGSSQRAMVVRPTYYGTSSGGRAQLGYSSRLTSSEMDRANGGGAPPNGGSMLGRAMTIDEDGYYVPVDEHNVAMKMSTYGGGGQQRQQTMISRQGGGGHLIGQRFTATSRLVPEGAVNTFTPSPARPLGGGSGASGGGVSIGASGGTFTSMNTGGSIGTTSGGPMKRAYGDYGSMLDYGFRIRFPRHTDKSRGLRHFSNKVCEKVKEKGQTNYNEVAEELVAEYFDSLPDPPTSMEKQQYDTKNIRRRVYDALNVLMAMNIIEKDKKEIHWVGLPTSSFAECRRLEEEKTMRQERLRQKTEQLHELIIQLVAYKSLVQRNRERERAYGRPADAAILYLPYIIVNTEKKTMVDCAISADKTEYWFNFDRPFEIHDDIEVLKRLGLAYGLDTGRVAPENLEHVKSCLPPALRNYVDQMLASFHY